MSKYLTHFPVKLSFELARGGRALRCAPLGYETAASQALPTGGEISDYPVLSPTVNRILLIAGHASCSPAGLILF